MALNSPAWAYKSVATLIESGGIVGRLIRLHGALALADEALCYIRSQDPKTSDSVEQLISMHGIHMGQIENLLERHGIPPDSDGNYALTDGPMPEEILNVDIDNLTPDQAVKAIEQEVCDSYSFALSADGLPLVDRETLLLQRSNLRRLWVDL